MTFFTDKCEAYLATQSITSQIEILTGYVNDFGADGAWHKQAEVQARIDEIRASNPSDSESFDKSVDDAQKAANKAAAECHKSSFVARNID